MALQPNLSLAVQVPQVKTPLESAQHAMTLQGSGQQQQLQRQQVKMNEQTLAGQQAALDDQAKVQRAWQAAGGDFDAFLTAAGQAGVHPDTLLKIQAGIDQAVETHAKRGKALLEFDQTKHGLLRERLEGFTAQMANQPVEQAAQAWGAFVQQQVADGLLDAGQAGQYQWKGPDTPKQAALALTTIDQLTKRALDAANLKRVQAEATAIETGGNINWQRDSVLLDGKPAVIQTNPRTGQSRDLNGQAIENAATRVKPIPTAAQTNAAPLPTQADIDVTPPSGPTANKPDPTTGQTPNAIHQDALVYALEGKLSSFGLGSNPRVVAARNAVKNRAGALAAVAGIDLPSLQQEYRAQSTTLNRLMPQVRATTGYAKAALDNMQLAENQSTKVARTGSPLVNRYLQWANGQTLVGNPALTKFETYIYTAAREYAKVTSGGALSAQALSDSAAKEASRLLNSAQTPEAFTAALEAMQDDMANVIKRQEENIAKTAPLVGNFLSVAAGHGPVTTPPTTAAPAKPADPLGLR